MRVAAAIAFALAAAASAVGAAAPDKDLPRFASIAPAKARMRTGPAATYPTSWLYQRAGLPVRVVGSYKEWRQVEDPGGTRGWMMAKLVSPVRTAIVQGGEPAPMLEAPSAGARLMWRAAPGVVGRVSRCGGGWCRLDVHGRAGFVATARLWGVGVDETLP